MANGRRDYWNVGRRPPVQETPKLDVFERLVQMGQSMAGMVQDTRDRRNQYEKTYLATLSEGYEGIHDNNVLQKKLDRLTQYKKDNLGQSSAESMELFNVIEDNFRTQMDSNFDFTSKVKDMRDKQKGIQDWTQYMYDYGIAGEEDRVKIRGGLSEVAFREQQDRKFQQMMVSHASDFSGWYAKHYNRIPNVLLNDLTQSETYMKSVLNSWKQDDKIDKVEYDLFYNGIMYGQAEPLIAFQGKRADAVKEVSQNQLKSYNESREVFRRIDAAIGYEGKEGSYQMDAELLNSLIPVSDADILAIGEGTTLKDTGIITLDANQINALRGIRAEEYEKMKELNKFLQDNAYQNLMYKDNRLVQFGGGVSPITDGAYVDRKVGPDGEIIEGMEITSSENAVENFVKSGRDEKSLNEQEIKHIQKDLGLVEDGVWGPDTSKAYEQATYVAVPEELSPEGVSKPEYIANLKESYDEKWKEHYDAEMWGALEEATQQKLTDDVKDVFYTKEDSDSKLIKMGENDFISIEEIKEAGKGTDLEYKEKPYSSSAKNIEKSSRTLKKQLKENKDYIARQIKKDLNPQEERELKRLRQENRGLQRNIDKRVLSLKKLGYYLDKNGNVRNKEIDEENYKWAKRWMKWYRSVKSKDVGLMFEDIINTSEDYDRELYERFYTGKPKTATAPGGLQEEEEVLIEDFLLKRPTGPRK